jgi:hypothetical protein
VGAVWTRWRGRAGGVRAACGRRAGGVGSERTGARWRGAAPVGRRAAPAACGRARGAGRVARRRRGRREWRGVEKQKGRRKGPGVGYFE